MSHLPTGTWCALFVACVALLGLLVKLLRWFLASRAENPMRDSQHIEMNPFPANTTHPQTSTSTYPGGRTLLPHTSTSKTTSAPSDDPPVTAALPASMTNLSPRHERSSNVADHEGQVTTSSSPLPSDQPAPTIQAPCEAHFMH